MRGSHFRFRTDYEPIGYLQSKATLSPRQQSWPKIVLQNSFNIIHIKEQEKTATDALNRRNNLESKMMECKSYDIKQRIRDAQKRDGFNQKPKKKIEDLNSEQPLVVSRIDTSFLIEHGLVL